MPITPERLEEFKKLYKKEFKKPISMDKAREIASRLVELYMLLAEPLPSERGVATPPEPSAQATDPRSSPADR